MDSEIKEEFAAVRHVVQLDARVGKFDAHVRKLDTRVRDARRFEKRV